jgi:sec-independent protein translocase protein TatA/sec-independent protein translocase protein TatB
MFGLSFFELLAIFTLALLLFGPEKLPEIAKVLGRLSGELKKTSDSVRREFYNSIYPPAEELQATYRKLTTTPFAQLEGTCEEKTKLTETTQENKEQTIEPQFENDVSKKTLLTLTGSNLINTLDVVPEQRENLNHATHDASDPTHIKPETSNRE